MATTVPPAIYNLGSLNIDRVFRVPHIVAPGETIASTSVGLFAGGKGANQSVALARARAKVTHIGSVGADGQWLLDKLSAEGIDTRWVRTGSSPTGQAIIQVDDAGQNAIVLLGGANQDITPSEVTEAISSAPSGSWLLVQNETSAVAEAIRAAKQRGLRVAFNPAPFDDCVRTYPLDHVDLLCLNEIEAAAMSGEQSAKEALESLAARWKNCEILLTLGAEGAIYRGPSGTIHLEAQAVEVVDTTAAGDTFLGYFLAGRNRELTVRQCLELASRAAALCVTRSGAMASIPRLSEVH